MKKSILLIFVIICIFNANAQFKLININENQQEKFTELNVSEIKSDDFFNEAKRVREFVPNKKIQNQEYYKINDTLLMDLFDDKQYKAFIDKSSVNINGSSSIRARLIDYKYGYCLISTTDGYTHIYIDIPELHERYLLKKHPYSDIMYLLKLDISKLEIPESISPVVMPDILKIINESKPKKKIINSIQVKNNTDSENNLRENKTDEKQNTVVDMMIVYTPAANNWATSNISGGIDNWISSIMDMQELVADNSLINTTFNLVHSAQVTYTESGSALTDLQKFTFYQGFDPYGYGGPPYYMDEIHQWRDDYKADLCLLLIVTNELGGLSWILPDENGIPEMGFLLARVQEAGATYTVAHEVGHSFGCHHHKQQNHQPGPGVFSYSAGWRWSGSGNYCSVMTYADGQFFPDGITHTQLPAFSNPDVTYYGVPTGHVTDGDNARSIRETKEAVAAYRGLEANFYGTPTSIYEGETVTFTDISIGLPNSWNWSFPGGTPNSSTAQNPTVTYNTAGTYNVSLTISDGTTPITETKTNYITVAEAASCIFLHYPLQGTERIYLSENGGYLSGNNGYGDLAKADYFQYGGSGTIENMRIHIGAVDGTNGNVEFAIWENNGGTPGSKIAGKTITMAELSSAFNEEGDPFLVEFDNPVIIEGNFFAGFFVSTGDAFAVTTTTNGDGPNTAWEMWSDSKWYPYDSSDSWGFDLTHAIFPEICPIVDVDLYSKNKIMIFPNPASDNITIINAENSKIQIINILGKVIYNLENAELYQNINISRLSNGIYFVKINSEVYKININR